MRAPRWSFEDPVPVIPPVFNNNLIKKNIKKTTTTHLQVVETFGDEDAQAPGKKKRRGKKACLEAVAASMKSAIAEKGKRCLSKGPEASTKHVSRTINMLQSRTRRAVRDLYSIVQWGIFIVRILRHPVLRPSCL